MNKDPINVPEFPVGLEWFNTERPLQLMEQRGKVVLLYFWTYSSVECMQLQPDLRYLENKFPNGLTVIGVHTPKFPHEKQASLVQKAINRLHIQHAVVLDDELKLWQQFRIRAWPTLIYINPEGKIVGVLRGEGKRKKLERAIAKDLDQAEAAGIHNSERNTLQLCPEPSSPLRFPGKLHATEGRLYISDSGRNRVLEADRSGRVRRIFGTGSPGFVDGQVEFASFNNPQGLVKVGEDLYVADAGNHALRRIRLDTGDVETAAGTGEPARPISSEIGSPLTTGLNMPWDLTYNDGVLYIAMAGQHQIWQFHLNSKRLGIYAGSGLQALEDGPGRNACFAQPLGITFFSDHLFVVDANASAIRAIRVQTKTVSTVVGKGLMDFGDHDGIGRDVRLQHPQAIVADPKREFLWVADTFNSKVKTISFRDNRVRNFPLAHELEEPGGMCLIDDTLYVANTNAHEILAVDISSHVVRVIEIDELG